jgi:hypothetical protein
MLELELVSPACMPYTVTKLIIPRYLGYVRRFPLVTSPAINTHLVSDFADEYPEAEVIGSDLSPIQPT